ncbi:MAG TPA: hypothetical protein VK846_04225, partial [Candidatus Limnocylindria bacterium]|nr:hypothetical protein [Candidatus Limnocylindria bacterium]
MNRPVKIILYIVFITMAVGFGIAAKNQVRLAAASEKQRQKNLDEAVAIESETNARAIEITNAPSSENTNTAAAESTNLPAAEATNIVPRKAAPPVSGPQRSYSKMISYTLLCAVGFVGFAFLLARDVSLLLAHKAEQALFSDDGAPVDPEYEQAEELWKDGKYLEALNGMREYLNKHPREQYVALRIAEIYEQNLNNPIAAALEYEELLKKNLPAERWGWAAIHLANIYSGKLNQPDKAVALLHRIDSEYGHTSA